MSALRVFQKGKRRIPLRRVASDYHSGYFEAYLTANDLLVHIYTHLSASTVSISVQLAQNKYNKQAIKNKTSSNNKKSSTTRADDSRETSIQYNAAPRLLPL